MPWTRLARSLARTRRRGDNAGMARDDSRAQLRRVALMLTLDGTRPSGALEWVSCVAPVVTRAVVGAAAPAYEPFMSPGRGLRRTLRTKMSQLGFEGRG
jgi:hypothetical protein